MFSFFKKKDQDFPPTAGRASPSAGQAAAGDLSSLDDGDQGLSAIEVRNGESSLSPAEEQAVILHSNGDAAAAIAVLQGEWPQISGRRALETWLMLFELYQQAQDRSAFETLSMEFVAEFEKTPPIWREVYSAPSPPRPASGKICSFGPSLTIEAASGELEQLRAAAGQSEPLRLDFGKVFEIDLFAVVELLGLWQLSKRSASPLQVSGAAGFIRLLSGKIQTGRNVPAEAPCWLLLMELYQSLGQLEAFENLAIEYAITYEVSPPSWEARLAPSAPSQGGSEDSAVPLDTEGFALQGAITSQHSQVFAGVRQYVESHGQDIMLDFRDVPRVDFESAGQFLNLFMAGLQQGKRIRLVQVNELVLGLLRIMGITEMVSVERRKAS